MEPSDVMTLADLHAAQPPIKGEMALFANGIAGGAQISIKGDGHPTPCANRVRAAQIKAAIDEKLSRVLLADAK